MMKAREVRRRLEAAIKAFMARDRYLLEHDLREECISARLAFYLQNAFKRYSVDVEYNRDANLVKRLHLPEKCANKLDHDGRALVSPDVIIHRRGVKGPNVLVIEIKKTSNPHGFDCDRRRIHAFRDQFRYTFGALLECETRPGQKHGMKILEWIPATGSS